MNPILVGLAIKHPQQAVDYRAQVRELWYTRIGSGWVPEFDPPIGKHTVDHCEPLVKGDEKLWFEEFCLVFGMDWVEALLDPEYKFGFYVNGKFVEVGPGPSGFGGKVMAKRIQRKRGRMPQEAVYVGRPSRWGNYKSVIRVNQDTGDCVSDREAAYRLYKRSIELTLKDEPDFLKPLRGKDLACWCKPEELCHADILLKLANR